MTQTAPETLADRIEQECAEHEHRSVTGLDINLAWDEIDLIVAALRKSPDSDLRATLKWISEQRWNEDADLDDICTRAESALTSGQSSPDKTGAIAVIDRCQQIAGKALEYPWYKDDQKNFPGSTEVDGVCIGEHVEETIVQELADAYTKLKALSSGK
jgi:hypothetical protein